MRSSSSLHLKLDGVRVALSDAEWAGRRLFAHQEALRETEPSAGKLVLLDAPTGSGKTLACLLRALEAQGDALFLYPTNELLSNQALQMYNNLKSAGYRVRAIGLRDVPDAVKEPEITLAAVNSETLDEISAGHAHGEALDRLLRESAAGKLILLTNPDILFALMQFKYKRSRLIWDNVPGFRLGVVDEFHLYYGVALLHLVLVLWWLRDVFSQVILSSATASGAIEIVEECLGSAQRIVAVQATDDFHSRVVRYPTGLEITHRPEILGRGLGDVTWLAGQAERLWRETEGSGAAVRVLVIVNSVVFAEELYRHLQKRFGDDIVSTIHGFVPQRQRRLAPIVVGTSAIEIGVDFDAAAVIFEAREALAFIQRLGRGARHRPGHAMAVIPTERFEPMAQFFGFEQGGNRETKAIRYGDLLCAVQQSLAVAPAYAEFARSETAIPLYLGLLLQVFRQIEGHNSFSTLRSEMLNDRYKPPFYSENTLEKVWTDRVKPVLLNACTNAAFRGHICTVPVYFETYSSYGQVSIFDLWKLDFTIRNGDERALLTVKEIRRTGTDWRIILEAKLAAIMSRKVGVLRKGEQKYPFAVKAEGSELEAAIGSVVDGLPCYLGYQQEDWRLRSVVESRSGRRAFLGADALLAEFLSKLA